MSSSLWVWKHTECHELCFAFYSTVNILRLQLYTGCKVYNFDGVHLLIFDTEFYHITIIKTYI